MRAVGDLLVAVGVVAIAELGDKSQLLAMTLATRYRTGSVLLGLTIGAALLMALSVGAGRLVGEVVPEGVVRVAAGLGFLGFAVWTLLDRDADEEEVGPDRRRGGRWAVLTVAGTFALAELGDRTMLATMALATQRGPVATWVGATVGMVAANLLGLAVGDWLRSHVSPRTIRTVAAALFALFGVLLLAGVG